MVMRILLDLNRKHGITMVIVTHDVHLRGFADRILHLRDGKVLIPPPPRSGHQISLFWSVKNRYECDVFLLFVGPKAVPSCSSGKTICYQRGQKERSVSSNHVCLTNSKSVMRKRAADVEGRSYGPGSAKQECS